MANSFIDLCLEEIARDYGPGTLPWAKANRPDEWKKMLTLERRVNEMALGDNQEGLRGVLDEYQELIVAMLKEFKSQPAHGRQGALAFEEMG